MSLSYIKKITKKIQYFSAYNIYTILTSLLFSAVVCVLIISSKTNKTITSEASLALFTHYVSGYVSNLQQQDTHELFVAISAKLNEELGLSYLIIRDKKGIVKLGIRFAKNTANHLVFLSNKGEFKLLSGLNSKLIQKTIYSFTDNLGNYFQLEMGKSHKSNSIGVLVALITVTILFIVVNIFLHFHYVRNPLGRINSKVASKLGMNINSRQASQAGFEFLTKTNDLLLAQIEDSKEETVLAMFQLRELNNSIDVKLVQRTEELEVSYKKLEAVSLLDPLTHLSNRTLFSDRLLHILDTSKRNRKEFTLLIIDIKDFKIVNELHGHMVGDDILKEIASRFRQEFRKSDTIARFGGDQFSIILPDSGVEYVSGVKDKVLSCFDKKIEIDTLMLEISASIGAAVFPTHGEDAKTLLKRADGAMFTAKRLKLNFKVFDLEENFRRMEQDNLVKELKWAIENNGLSLNYQPIIALSTGLVCGVEVLCRWIDPNRGFIPPDVFIPIAEKNGLILPLTDWVFDKALSQVSIWHSQGHKITVSINLSAESFLDSMLPIKISALLKKFNVDVNKLCLEITETVTMSDPDRTMKLLETLSSIGIIISIDDFGTGYSSLSYLSKFHIDQVKIDRCFIMNMDSSEESRIIVNSTIELAHMLGKHVVAEGVENQAIIDLLDKYGCDKLQGFYICKPCPAEQLEEWFTKSNWSPLLHNSAG